MSMTRSFAPRLLSLLALGVLASPALAGGCGGNSNVTPPQKASAGGSAGSGGATAGRGGTSGSATGGSSGRGGTGGKGAQGGTMNVEDGGEAGESAGGAGGATGGSAGKGSGGSAGQAQAGGAGMSAGGPQGGNAGQSSGGAGQSGSAGSGTAGSGTAGMVGVLGTPCSPPGALACAGNHQKLTVLCGGDGEWEPNQTCGSDEYCDSTPGPNVGTCQPVAAGCEDGPATTFCEADGRTLVRCSADAVSTTPETCDEACRGNMCRDAPECPVWSDYDVGVSCASECTVQPDRCFIRQDSCRMYADVVLGPGKTAIVRTPWADDACPSGCAGQYSVFPVSLVQIGANRAIRISVPEQWKYQPNRSLCAQVLDGCVVMPASEALGLRFVSFAPGVEPAHIVIENLPWSATCGSDGGEGEGGQSG